MAEMGLGVIFPLLLILNLGMPPALAGLALIPTTVPMVILSPLAGRWSSASPSSPSPGSCWLSLDTIPEHDHGQASGVSATAEQGAGRSASPSSTRSSTART
jgi:hypothetical protein